MTDSSGIDSSGTPATARGSWRINKPRRRRARHSQRVTESNSQAAQAGDAHGDDSRADALGEPDSESDNAFEKIMQRKEIREVVSYTIGSREDGGVLDSRGQPEALGPNRALITLIRKGPHADIIPQSVLPWPCCDDEQPGSPAGPARLSSPSPAVPSPDAPIVQPQTANGPSSATPAAPSMLTAHHQPPAVQSTQAAASEWTAAAAVGGGHPLQQTAQPPQSQASNPSPPAPRSGIPDHPPAGQLGVPPNTVAQPQTCSGSVTYQPPPTAGLTTAPAPGPAGPAGPPARPPAPMPTASQPPQAPLWTADAVPHITSVQPPSAPGVVPGSYPGQSVSHGVAAGMPHPSQPQVNQSMHPTALAYGSLHPQVTCHLPSGQLYVGPAGQVVQAGHAFQTGQAGQALQTGQTGQVVQTGQAIQAGQAVQAGPTAQTAHTVQAVQAGLGAPPQPSFPMAHGQPAAAVPNSGGLLTAAQPVQHWTPGVAGLPQATTQTVPPTQPVNAALSAQPTDPCQGTLVHPGQPQASTQPSTGHPPVEPSQQTPWPPQQQNDSAMDSDPYGLSLLDSWSLFK
ncbi:hypothetical protein BDV27DRAFT_166792 [Aspergillus caelatus]|uniref:Uncharacterized protein n=1 Tax=Aspergillus caelatus TaxID=61420 RepID=A0A5N6ZZ30_9EURO|nr:uncharacterized protein BDV27DRAFT_166792 [Aspergillus caelatus]KAE8361550.1 hypothetical protein BDV27DRAFT_166792 [Aspergillus caelatus]